MRNETVRNLDLEIPSEDYIHSCKCAKNILAPLHVVNEFAYKLPWSAYGDSKFTGQYKYTRADACCVAGR